MRSNGATVGAGPLTADADAVQAAIDDLAAAVADGAVRDAGHDQLTATVRGLRAAQARLEAVLLTVVREVDQRGTHVQDGALTAASWLRMATRMTPREAAGCVRTARALSSGKLDATAAALAAGEIDPAHARLIAKATADAPAGAVALIEPEALAAAREADPRAVAAVMAAFTHALDPDSADAAALRRLDRRGLTAGPTLDGMLAGTFLADPASGSLIMTALDAADPLLTGEHRTAAQRRLDALVDICRRFLGSPDAPMHGGGHPHVIVTTDADTAAAAPGQTGSPGATMSWVGPIPGSTARRLACDADTTTVHLDEHGNLTHLHRDRRFFTHPQRLAMIARDGDRCPLPWCDRPITWSDGHHLTPWTAGGPTTVDNGLLPCAAHHTMLHEGHWTLTRLHDGRYQMRHRDGRVIGPEPHPPGHNRPPPRQRE